MGAACTRPVHADSCESDKQPFVLMPLYIYPLEGAWEPLFKLARALPEVLFVTVINPNNGPGPDALPDAGYQAALRELSSIPNIRPIGYVHCTYGKRSLDEIKADVDTYREWNDQFRMEGIFIDETPGSLEHAGYLKSISDHTKQTWQKFLDRPGLIVYNPGVVVDPIFFDSADWIVVFEQSEKHWRTKEIQQSLTRMPEHLRPQAVAIVHSLSGDLDEAADFTNEVKKLGFGGVHFTEELDGGYTKWPVMWDRVGHELV